jgi:hypothetical protein
MITMDANKDNGIDKVIRDTDAAIERLEARETQKSITGKPPERYYTLMVEKGMFRAVLEVIKVCFPTITCELDYKIEPLEGTIQYVVTQLCDYSSYFPSLPSPTLEDLVKKLPILFLREEGSSYIFARKAAETRVTLAIDSLFPEEYREEMLIYSMFTISERIGCLKDAASTYFDSVVGIALNGARLEDSKGVIFTEVYDFEIEDVSTRERHEVDPTLSINKPNYTLCFFE